MQQLKTLKNLLVKFMDSAVIVMMGALVLIVVYQVLARSLNLGGTAICSELAQFLLIWITLLGGSLAFMKKHHLGIDYFANKLTGSARRALDVFVQLCIAFFGGYILLFGGGNLVSLTLRFEQVSSATGIPMGYVYLALPLCGFFILILAFEEIVELLGKNEVQESE